MAKRSQEKSGREQLNEELPEERVQGSGVGVQEADKSIVQRVDELQPGERLLLSEREAVELDAAYPAGNSVTITLPIGELSDGYVSRFIEAKLDDEQARVLKRLVNGAKEQGLKLANGRPVDSGSSVVRYLLEQIALPAT